MHDFKHLQTCLQELSLEQKQELLNKVGYAKTVKSKALKRLEILQNASLLRDYFNNPLYDFHYSSREFLQVVAKQFNIDISEEIEAFYNLQATLSKLPEPYIFIQTHFKRASQPIFALALMEPKRRIKIDKEFVAFLKIQEILQKVGAIVKEHYVRSNGVLPLWGEITYYVYYHTNSKVYIFDKDGVLIEIKDSYANAKAIMCLK